MWRAGINSFPLTLFTFCFYLIILVGAMLTIIGICINITKIKRKFKKILDKFKKNDIIVKH